MKQKLCIIIAIACFLSAILLMNKMIEKAKPQKAAAKFLDIFYDENGFIDPRLRSLLTMAGWQVGDPSCMYFIKGIYMISYPDLIIEINELMNCYTQQTWKNCLESELFEVVTKGEPRPGDIVIWRNNDDKHSGHAGIVYEKWDDKHWHVIEGNVQYVDTKRLTGILGFKRELVCGMKGLKFTLLGFIRVK